MPGKKPKWILEIFYLSHATVFGMNKNTEIIEHVILIIRNQKVILDSDLAALYGVEVKRLNEAVKRNVNRFPADFMFQLTKEEAEGVRSRSQFATLNEDSNLRSQIATANQSMRRFLPYAFTEHGALMAANVLNSERAATMSVAIIRTFVKLRQMLSLNKDLSRRLDELEKKYDATFQFVFDEIRKLRELPEEPEVLETKITGFTK